MDQGLRAFQEVFLPMSFGVLKSLFGSSVAVLAATVCTCYGAYNACEGRSFSERVARRLLRPLSAREVDPLVDKQCRNLEPGMAVWALARNRRSWSYSILVHKNPDESYDVAPVGVGKTASVYTCPAVKPAGALWRCVCEPVKDLEALARRTRQVASSMQYAGAWVCSQLVQPSGKLIVLGCRGSTFRAVQEQMFSLYDGGLIDGNLRLADSCTLVGLVGGDLLGDGQAAVDICGVLGVLLELLKTNPGRVFLVNERCRVAEHTSLSFEGWETMCHSDEARQKVGSNFWDVFDFLSQLPHNVFFGLHMPSTNLYDFVAFGHLEEPVVTPRDPWGTMVMESAVVQSRQCSARCATGEPLSQSPSEAPCACQCSLRGHFVGEPVHAIRAIEGGEIPGALAREWCELHDNTPCQGPFLAHEHATCVPRFKPLKPGKTYEVWPYGTYVCSPSLGKSTDGNAYVYGIVYAANNGHWYLTMHTC